MTYEAAIRFAPITSVDRLNDPRRQGRTLYERLMFLPSESSVPLVVNHDYGRELGRVEKVFRHEDVDGPWWVASCSLNECPSWLGRGTRASFEFKALQRSSFEEDIVRHALIREVSVLTDDVKPYEPFARVMYVKPTEPKPAVIRRSNAPVARRRNEIDELRRRMEWLGDVPMELVLENMKRELGYFTGVR